MGYRRVRVVALLALMMVFLAPDLYGAPGRDIRERAVQMAYRIDVELEPVDAAQRHLLVWHLVQRFVNRSLVGTSVSDDWLIWGQRLEQLESSLPKPLPTWFEPTRPDTVTYILGFHDAGHQEIGWDTPSTGALQAAAAAVLVLEQDAPRLSRALTPGLLAWAGIHGPEIWAELLQSLADQPELVPLVDPLVRPWLALPLDAPLEDWLALTDEAAIEIQSLRADSGLDSSAALIRAVDLLSSESLHIDIGDPVAVRQARYSVFLHSDQVDELDRILFSLAETALGLERGRYTDLLQTLSAALFTVTRRVDLIDARPRVAAALDALSRLDPGLPDQLAEVDDRLLGVYQQLRRLLRDWSSPGSEAPTVSRTQLVHDLASLGSALELLAGDLDGYLAQPFRQAFEDRLLVCFGLGADVLVHPPEPISREDFDACAETFHQWATQNAGQVELAGDSGGPFEAQHRSRELALDPYQRLNYWQGYVGEELATSCSVELTDSLVNPIEWAIAARAFVRFSERWPAYFQAAGLDDRLESLLAIGQSHLERWEQLDECRGQGSHPILAQLARYEQDLDLFGGEVRKATELFRADHLRAGADVRLDGDAWQATRYRPADGRVSSCSQEPSCGMQSELQASQALYQLFPGPLLVADQVGLGPVALCYQGVEWQDRRAELPAVKNQAMANYFGRLSFDLVGRYPLMARPVFRLRLNSDREFEYLFGANAPEVLEDPCPRHLVDTIVESRLPERPIQLVPNRLTYLTADRMQPAKVFDLHWAQGDEWQDWFVTGRGVERLEAHGPEDVVPLVNERLRALYQEWNAAVYTQMLTDDPLDDSESAVDLNEALDQLDLARGTSETLARILFPENLKHDPALRASLHGRIALFGPRQALQNQRDGVPVDMVEPMARSHFQDALLLWRRATTSRNLSRVQPETLVTTTLLELIRLRSSRPTTVLP